MQIISNKLAVSSVPMHPSVRRLSINVWRPDHLVPGFITRLHSGVLITFTNSSAYIVVISGLFTRKMFDTCKIYLQPR